jgi:hypothetical protein
MDCCRKQACEEHEGEGALHHRHVVVVDGNKVTSKQPRGVSIYPLLKYEWNESRVRATKVQMLEKPRIYKPLVTGRR